MRLASDKVWSMVVIILQHISVSNQCAVHLKLTKPYMSIVSQ